MTSNAVHTQESRDESPNNEVNDRIESDQECEDEAISMNSDLTTSTSCHSEAAGYLDLHGRQYHGYNEHRAYFRPDDKHEDDRLEESHALRKFVHMGRLTYAPVEPSCQRVLDIGYGTGRWCVEMSASFSAAEAIIGIDLSKRWPRNTDLAPDPPRSLPPNVHLYVDDFEYPWTWPLDHFDFIHRRDLAGSVSDELDLFSKCFHYLKPGGWIEFEELDDHPHCEDGSLTPNHALTTLYRLLDSAASAKGVSLRSGAALEEYARRSGFVNVQVVGKRLHLGPWGRDPFHRDVGGWFRRQFEAGLEGMSYRWLIDVLHMTREEVDALLDAVRSDVDSTGIRAFFNLYTMYGQKPDTPAIVGEDEEICAASINETLYLRIVL